MDTPTPSSIRTSRRGKLVGEQPRLSCLEPKTMLSCQPFSKLSSPDEKFHYHDPLLLEEHPGCQFQPNNSADGANSELVSAADRHVDLNCLTYIALTS